VVLAIRFDQLIREGVVADQAELARLGKVSHCLTLFNVAEAYHNPQFPPRVPGSFYRDPFSDMIPRERIYEIWSAEPLVRVGNTQKTRSQCISAYSDTVKQQVAALRAVVWKFRGDMADRKQHRWPQATFPFLLRLFSSPATTFQKLSPIHGQRRTPRANVSSGFVLHRAVQAEIPAPCPEAA
jgi:hypothetical protein